jgi:hypothetical protein
MLECGYSTGATFDVASWVSQPPLPAIRLSAAGHAAQVAEKDLAGPLRELVSAVLSEGSHG